MSLGTKWELSYLVASNRLIFYRFRRQLNATCTHLHGILQGRERDCESVLCPKCPAQEHNTVTLQARAQAFRSQVQRTNL